MATVIPGTPALARHQRTPALLLETIRDLGGVTRADLSRLTGLSRSAVAHAVAALLADGLITEREPGGGHAGQRGRPATLLTPSRPPGHVVGIDFGHAHVGVAIADTTVSRQPRLPHQHHSVASGRLVCPISPAIPAAPR